MRMLGSTYLLSDLFLPPLLNCIQKLKIGASANPYITSLYKREPTQPFFLREFIRIYIFYLLWALRSLNLICRIYLRSECFDKKNSEFIKPLQIK